MSSALLDVFPLPELTEEHVRSLVTLRVEEDVRLEYKQELRLQTDADKRELCKDISAMANTRGGYIIYGIRENGNARAAAADGIPFDSQDEDRLVQVITSGITPRLQLFEITKVPVARDRFVVVVRVQRDGELRQVKYNDNRSYKRVGKLTVVMEPSDYSAFYRSGGGASREAEIIDERKQFEAAVKSGGFHGLRAGNGLLALAVIPQNPPGLLDLNRLNADVLTEMPPMYCSGWDRQFRGDALITFGVGYGERHPYAVTELSHHGSIKAANSLLLSSPNIAESRLPDGAMGYIPSIAFERELIVSAHRYLSLLGNLEVAGPWSVGISLLNIRGYVMGISRLRTRPDQGRIFRSDDLIVPPVAFANSREAQAPQDVATKLRAAFDYVWREFNFPGSFNYDREGNWSDSLQ